MISTTQIKFCDAFTDLAATTYIVNCIGQFVSACLSMVTWFDSAAILVVLQKNNLLSKVKTQLRSSRKRYTNKTHKIKNAKTMYSFPSLWRTLISRISDD